MKILFLKLVIISTTSIVFLKGGDIAVQKFDFRRDEAIKISLLKKIGVSEAKTKNEENYQFYSIDSIDCDISGKIYVFDRKDVCIKIFDKNGQFLRKILSEGQGPNEIINPLIFRINKFTGNIFIIQENGFKMKEFDEMGRFITQYYLPAQFYQYFEFINRKRIIFIASGKYGEKEYNNFKILDLASLKIDDEFAPTQGSSLTNAYQRFIIKEGLLWTSPQDKMELICYEVKTGKKVKQFSIEESYKENKIINGPNWRRIALFNFAQPLLIGSDIYVLVTKQEYSDKTFKDLKFRKLYLYHLEKNHLKKVSQIFDDNFMLFGTVWRNRLILYTLDPYPHVAVMSIND